MNNRHPNEHFVKKNVDKLRDFVSKWNEKRGPNRIAGIASANSDLLHDSTELSLHTEILEAIKTENEALSALNKLNEEKIDLLNEKLELVYQIVKSHENMIEAQTRMIEAQNKVLLEVQSHKRLIEELQHSSEDFETRISNLENFMELTDDA